MTKLKDLRTPSSSEIGGIKRFFEPVETGSPCKKRRREHTDHDSETILPQPDQGDDEYDEAMPGFHEHDEDDNLSLKDLEMVELELEGHHNMREGRPRPPVSAPSSSQNLPMKGVTPPSGIAPRIYLKPHSTSSLNPISTLKPHSTRGLPTEPEAIDSVLTDTHSCPICGKTLQTDNTGLNAHIDFCLSRKTIREAQNEAGGLTKLGGRFQWGKNGGADKGKITSAGKRKKV